MGTHSTISRSKIRYTKAMGLAQLSVNPIQGLRLGSHTLASFVL